MNYDFLRSEIRSIKFIDDANHQIEQLQSWMWWEDHAVLRNTLILLLLLFITGGLLLLSFLMRRNMILSFVFVPLTVIFFVFTVFIILLDSGLRTPIYSSNTYIAKYLAPHEYKHQLNLQKENIEREEKAAQVENKWDNAKKEKAVVQSIKFNNDDSNLKIKINNQWYTNSDRTTEYVEDHIDKGYEIKYKKVNDELWVLGFES
jgi:hypothetical protein